MGVVVVVGRHGDMGHGCGGWQGHWGRESWWQGGGKGSMVVGSGGQVKGGGKGEGKERAGDASI